MLPPWVLISRFSKNIVLDAMIFDTVLVVTYSLGLLHFTNSWTKFQWNNWLGFALMFLGMFIFKKGL
jgi:choline-glycine betaine transporter